MSSLLQHVEGSSWTVDYYSQVLGADQELSPQQLDKSAVYQQYTLIEGFELKVTMPLAQTQDQETKGMTVTGAGTTYPTFIPNKGDMFLADIGDGRVGRFTVTTAEQKSYMKESLYSIEYVLVDYLDENHLKDLQQKTVKSVRYEKEFLYFGQNPQVLSEDFDYLVKFRDALGHLTGLYMHDFFSREYQTLLIPDQQQVSYDPFLPKFLLDVVDTDAHPLVARIRMPNVSGDQAYTVPTIWDCLGRMDQYLLPMALHQARLISSLHFRTQPHMAGVHYAGIAQVIYPMDNRADVDAKYDGHCPTGPTEALLKGGRRFTDFLRQLPNGTLNGLSYTAAENELPDIVRVTDDPFYVLSEPFYRGQAPLSSNLERLVLAALKQEAIDKVVLYRLTQNAMKWENLERFYYIPILLALLKVATRTN